MMKTEDIMFRVGRWPELMYKLERKRSTAIQGAEVNGSTDGWSKVLQEGFSCLLDKDTPKVDTVPSGCEVERTVLDEMTKLSEFKALQQYTQGDEYASGQAIVALSKTIVAKMGDKKGSADVESLRNDVEGLKALEEFGGNVQEDLEVAEDKLEKALKEQQELARGIDPVAVRVAVRQAAKQAMEEIQAEREAISALSWGSEPGEPINRSVNYREDAEALRQSDKLRRIAMEAGRQRALACKKQSEKAEEARVEVDSIETGDEISRMLGSELMMLVSDDETEELMFYQRYADKQCLQLKLGGKEEKQQGPIVFVVDTSGSQTPYEVKTKAVVLAMLDVAKLQNRSFGVVWFDSRVSRVDYLLAGGKVSTKDIMAMMSHWTSGGTNFQAALDKAVELIETDGGFKQADVVMVTDGACNTDSRWDSEFQEAKKRLSFTVYTVLTSTRYTSTVDKWSDQVWPIADLMSDKVQDKIYSI
jgi:uncharacterized protein with von Willebrand factor type A (vWA) domain